jgi:RNA polymerase sigma-70 factor (family 1)
VKHEYQLALTASYLNKGNLYDHEMLLLKISQGDQGAFSTLFNQYRNQLFTYLFKITKSAETSEEMVLDVFLKIWHGKEAIPQIENFDAFLYRVAHNKAIDFLRSVKRNPVLQQQVWDLMQEPPSGENADESLLFKNTEAIITAAVNSLTPQRQKVFILHHQGLTNEEIAERLQLSRNTVRNHLAASVDFIRKFLSSNYDLLLFLFLLKK